jgi:phosphoesterase RecJ-like protein
MTIAEAAAFLYARDDFIISSHETPDADGLGAEFALSTALSRMGKRVRVVNADRYSDAYKFLDTDGIIGCLAEAKLDEAEIQRSTAVLVDTSDIMYSGDVADRILAKAREVIIIDHHLVKGQAFAPICSMPSLSSTCEIVYRIINELGYDIQADVATALYAGIVYDTGSFAYSKTSAGTFEAALDLVRRGANPSRIHGALYESGAVSVLLLRRDVMSTLELHDNDRIAVQTLSRSMLAGTGSAYQEADGFINIPLQAAAVEVSIFLKENEEGVLRCSLRSKGAVDVANIAQSFGGGGHKSAAGFKSPYPLETIKGKVLELVVAALPALRS